MRVILELADNYDDVLTITACGNQGMGVNVTVAAVNLQEHDYLRIDERGVLRFTPKGAELDDE